jgi:hypothetical protein
MMTSPFPAAVIAGAREAARGHLRSVGREEDALIERLAAAALGLAEAYGGQALIVREHGATIGPGAAWQALPVVPVRSIVAGAPVVAVDIDADGTGWVRMAAMGEVRFVAGLAADWASLPPAVAQGVVLLIAHWFDTRESGAVPPAAVGALWRPWRRMRLQGARR